MKIKGRYIVIIIILIVYFLLMYFWLGKDNLKKEKLSTKIIIGNSSVWELYKKSWTNINNESNLKRINWSEFKVINDDKKLGTYYVWYDSEEWYLFDKDKNAVNYEGRLLAYRANYDIKVDKFKVEEVTDYSDIAGFLKEKNIDINSELTVNSYVNFDIDNDGVDEVIYLFSNVFSMESNPEEVFSLVFAKKNDSIYILYDSVEENDGYNGCKPYINYILDIDDDNEKEIILSCGRYSDQKPIDMLFKFKNDSFNILVTNQ